MSAEAIEYLKQLDDADVQIQNIPAENHNDRYIKLDIARALLSNGGSVNLDHAEKLYQWIMSK